ncbi:hypothetical protein FA13DRAFT_1740292 [Coprinellus micaceus]|uniref:Nephrocystin 3-like N-terminal domain-containing protein n=1 Tax=Coprinellus micaceus TaxID=71717 RepID=A0A4Y7SMP2_COPMI|nr:hypothetical protein FA13DRAFT_1740292 [Coprinellus micaceus]
MTFRRRSDEREHVAMGGSVDYSPPQLNASPSTPSSVPPPPSHWQEQGSPYVLPHSSYFDGAHGFSIDHLHLNIQPPYPPVKSLFEHLSPHIAYGSAHNSGERCDAPKCDPQTRVAVQEEIMGWIKHGDSDPLPKKMMWLSGPAGAGKTAIAGSVAETCATEGVLAASFFFSAFSGSLNRRSKRCFIATLAHHIAGHRALHQFERELLCAVRNQPDIFHKTLRDQAECLLIGPFRAIWNECDRRGWPKVIIVDGLDEVEAEQYHDPTRQESCRAHEDDQHEILNALLAVSQCPPSPSRRISDFFATSARASTIDLFLDSKYSPDADIARYLGSKFAEIRRRSGITDVSWPGQTALDQIVDISSGQFVVPTTIIRWVEAGVPQQQLNDVLQQEWMRVGTRNPFAALDALYRHILIRAHNPDDDPRLVVKWILCIATRDTSGSSAQFWRQMLESVEGELKYRMEPISSLIFVPPHDSALFRITIYHKSLIDFLCAETRSGDFFVDKPTCNTFLTDRIVKVLKDQGPSTQRRSSANDLRDFMAQFLCLKPFGRDATAQGTQAVLHLQSSAFLRFLSEGSKTDLALCDAGWWTHLLITGRVSEEAESHQDAIASLGQNITIIGSILCGIHKAMECSPMVISSTHDSTAQLSDLGCHAACRLWRGGILSKAKELNWCVHEIEQVEVGQLERLTIHGFNRRFKQMGQTQSDGSLSRCDVCQPILGDS